MPVLKAESGSYAMVGSEAELIFRHSANTWQTWAFLFAASLTLAFAVIDALWSPAALGWLVAVTKVGVFFCFGYLVMVNRWTRRQLLNVFEKIVRTE